MDLMALLPNRIRSKSCRAWTAQRLRLCACAIALALLLPFAVFAQSGRGELRIAVQDPQGLPVRCQVEIISQSAQVHETAMTDANGRVARHNLPFGTYVVSISNSGFAAFSEKVAIESRIPVHLPVRLTIGREERVLVTDAATLVNPEATGSEYRVGAGLLQNSFASQPGRTLIDAVASQPGWVLESNGTLHPRGSEYQVQYLVDGIPLTENRSPSFSAGSDADDVQSLTVLTGDFPAEYGRKLGGVVEVTRKTELNPGWHGQFGVMGGSFRTAGVHGDTGYGWGRNALSVGGDEETTGRYLDPPVLENFTNHGLMSGERLRYQRELGGGDRAVFSVEHRRTGFDVPNEFLQQQAGQRQDRANSVTTGTANYEHVISSHALADGAFMLRDVDATLFSNANSTPVRSNQEHSLREVYGKGTVSLQRGKHNLKLGVESDNSWLREQFAYAITNASFFDPGTAADFEFLGHGYDGEQAFFAQDLLHVGNWAISGGIRYDHYGLLVSRSAVSPRVGVGWYWPRAELNVHASFDRVFQTPASENILLSSSSAVRQLSSQVLRLPVQPSTGNYWDVGITKAFLGTWKLDVDWYRRSLQNYADDDLLLNTGVAFPISFRSAHIYGGDAKLSLTHLGRFSGFASYSYMVGFDYTPVTGGLFLGSDAAGVLAFSRFPISQDQRNTVTGQAFVRLTSRVWSAFTTSYGSGLPTEFGGSPTDALQQYGSAVVSRIDFRRGRVRPSLALGASLGADLIERNSLTLRIEADCENLNDRINVINFAGLFSGTGIASPRSYAVRFAAQF